MPAKTKPKPKPKTKNKKTKSKTTTARKTTSVKKTAKKKMAVKSEIRKKGLAKKKAVKTKARARKKAGAGGSSKPKGKVREKSQNVEPFAFSVNRPGVRSGRQSGDLQGLSRLESADSESVAELLEEGNTFEAEVVLGVEGADADESEVRTHQVPEDDVPDEYLDKD